VEWAESQNKVLALVAAARAANPDNLALQAIEKLLTGDRQAFRPPPLPDTFVVRPGEYGILRDAILAADPAISGTLTTVLQGTGGFGKTTLAAALCTDADVLTAFPGGIIWVTIGQQIVPSSLLAELYTHTTGQFPPIPDPYALADALAAHWRGQRVLLVLDDAWTEDAVRPFLRAGAACTRLVTTRNIGVIPKAFWIRIDEMQTTEAVALLAAQLAAPPSELAPFAVLARRLGEWPLLLELAGRVLRFRMDLGDTLAGALAYVERALTRHGPAAFDRTDPAVRNEAVASSLAISLDLLTPTDRARYNELAIFPEDTAVPFSTVATLWREDDFDAEERLMRLAALALLRLDLPSCTMHLHDVIRAYLVGQLADPPAVHRQLLSAWGDLTALPDGYAWRWLGYHLRGAEQETIWRALRLDYDWLAGKLAATTLTNTLADYEPDEADPVLGMVLGVLRLAAPVLTTPASLASQLLGRMGNAMPELRGLLAGAQQAILQGGLRPRRASLLGPNPALRHTLIGHTASVAAVALTPDGQCAVSASRDGTLRVWALATGSALHTLVGHTAPIAAVTLTTDGQRAISASYDMTLRVWALDTGASLHILSGHTGPVRAVALTADGQRAVSASADGTLRVWALEAGVLLFTLVGHTAPVTAVVLTADGQRAVSASEDGTLRLWDLTTGQPLYILVGHTRAVTAVAVTADGQRAISGSEDATARVWALDARVTLSTLEGYLREVTVVVVTRDGRRAVAASADGSLRVVALDTGATLFTLHGHMVPVRAVALTADGSRVVSGAADAMLRIWDLNNISSLFTLKGHMQTVTAVAVTGDGQCIVSGSADNTVRVWTLNTGRALFTEVAHEPFVSSAFSDQGLQVFARGLGDHRVTLDGHRHAVTAVAVTADERHAISASSDGTIRVWALDKGTALFTLKSQGEDMNQVEALAVTPDGTRLVSASWSGIVRVWALDTGRSIFTLTGHTSIVKAVAVTADGRRAVSAGADGTLRVWALDTGTALFTLKGHTDWVWAVAVTADGQRVVSASTDGTLRVWALDTGTPLFTLESCREKVTAIAVTADGQRAVSASSDGTIQVWALDTGAALFTLSGHTEWVEAVAITTDDRYVVSASRDETVRVWALDTGKALHTLVGHNGQVQAVAVTADGTQAISTSYDRTLRVWSLATGRQVDCFTADRPFSRGALALAGRSVVAGDTFGEVHLLELMGKYT
jgi:WD40 repeat protein